jgi:pSer/pThr/pTyr-binding forkhead associated (FHA) protein
MTNAPDVNPLGPTSPPGEANTPPQGQPPIVVPAPQIGPGGRRELVAFIVSYQGDPFGAYWPIHAGRNVVGRAGAADGLDLEINDPTTSSQHAAFHVDAATRGVHLEDLGSTNGTFVNEEPLGPQGRRELRDGDRVRFGGFTLVLKVIPRV